MAQAWRHRSLQAPLGWCGNFFEKRSISKTIRRAAEGDADCGRHSVSQFRSKRQFRGQRTGWGQENLDNILAPAQPASPKFIENSPGLQTGDLNGTVIPVRSGNMHFGSYQRTGDYPDPALVNDADLIVR